MKDYLTTLVINQRGPRKPILYWQAVKNKVVIAENNSIALLRARFGSSAIYKSVR